MSWRALALAVALLAQACGRAPDTSRRACVLFEGVSRTVPPGGVHVTIEVPAGWSEARHDDGSCRFAPARGPGLVSLSLPLCLAAPDRPCPGEPGRTTADLAILGQTMRTSERLVADPAGGRLVRCAAVVQGAAITADLVATLRRLERVCDTVTVSRAR